ncbi:MAG: SAM-dependent methyltransferase [Paludibacteraceae bacterium]
MNEETRHFILAHQHDDVRTLAFKTVPSAIDLHYALQQIEARQRLADKVPTWAANLQLEFPPHLSVEQCSSEMTARYKASLLQGDTFVDLTGGMGIDCFFVSTQFRQAHYVESQPQLADLAHQNFGVLAADICVHNQSAETFLEQIDAVSAIFIDPARRDNAGRKMVSISDCTPDVAALQHTLLAKAPIVLVKLSPMLDIAVVLRELRHVKAIHIVAVDNECKELLVELERDFDGEPVLYAVNLTTAQTDTFTFRPTDEKCAVPAMATDIGRYLYEPNAALLKAGAFRSIANRFNIGKLHNNSHLYTGNELKTDFPGRRFAIDRIVPFKSRMKPTDLPDIDKANIAVRNFPLSVAELRKQLKIGDGGHTFIFATTLLDNSKVLIICHKV